MDDDEAAPALDPSAKAPVPLAAASTMATAVRVRSPTLVDTASPMGEAGYPRAPETRVAVPPEQGGQLGFRPVPNEKRARQKANRAAKLAQEARSKRRRSYLKRGAIVVVGAAAVGGIAYAVTGGSSKPASSSATTNSSSTDSTDSAAQAAADKTAVAAGCPSNPKTKVNDLTWTSAPPMTIDQTKTYTATVKTDVGTFTMALDASKAPQTVNNFVFLADKGFYRCVSFHRVIPGFVDQTGDPTGTGNGGPGYTIPDEYPAKAANAADQYPLGSVAMANTGQPNTGGSQWFVVAGAQGESLPPQYSLFGQVTSGMDVVNKINQDGSTSGTPKVIHRILSLNISS